ncbi:Ig-like domain-containing protein [Brevibacillus sp. SYSU BS000544]|uniref:RCC1 domain-containing protein n=1 Tax=Brevibacillus sp. SYSU BS000544 TaxID=3416443 RepID=UPI003CE5BCD6
MKRLKNWVLSLAVAATVLPSSLASAATIEDIESPDIKAGPTHSIARKWDGTVWTWGYNFVGQLGDGTTNSSSSPVKVDGLSKILKVAAGYMHSMALKEDGSVWAWGWNEYGQLGNGTNLNQTEPAKVQYLEDVVAIEGGYYHSIASTKDGEVYTWGRNDSWQLGPNTASTIILPYRVEGIDKVADVGAGLNFSVALKKNGTVWTWGSNGDGQLGDGTYYSSNGVPVQATGLEDVTDIATGDRHIVALTDDGTVWAWGRNTDGQLGDGSANASNKPIKVPGMTDVVAIGAGTDFSLALKKDGTVWGWGSNYKGQLGGFNPNPYRSPIQITSLDGSGSQPRVVALTGGEHHTLVIKDDGSAWSLGINIYGQLGDGTTTDSYKPVKVKRVFGNNAHLKSLNLTAGSLKPGFNRKNTDYTATVDPSVANIALTPTAYENSAKILVSVNNVTEQVTSGHATDPHALVNGTNAAVIEVRTDDAFKIYKVTIKREAGNQVPVEEITLDQSELEMQLDSDPVALKATIKPTNATNKNVIWSSSNPKVVEVDQNGLVTSLDLGESTIRVTTEDGEKSAECLVIVKEEDEEPSIVELEVSEEVVLLKPSKTKSIKVYAIDSNGEKMEITRDKDTTYTSSEASIAKATKGLIRAGNKQGTADITVSYQDISTTIQVIVTKASVTKLNPSESKVTMKKGEEKEITLTATLSDKTEVDVTSLATWTSSNKKVVTVEDGKLKALSKGKTVIKATLEGKTTQISVTVK